MWGGYWHGDWGPGGWAMVIGHALWWVLLIVAIVVVARWATGARREPPSEDPALDVLRERYARGEIDAEEYAERKRVLGI